MKPCQKSLRLSLTLSLLVAAFHPAHAAEKEASPPDLTGIVRSKDGQPLKDAGVFIYTAGPRVGPGFL